MPELADITEHPRFVLGTANAVEQISLNLTDVWDALKEGLNSKSADLNETTIIQTLNC